MIRDVKAGLTQSPSSFFQCDDLRLKIYSKPPESTQEAGLAR